MTAQTENTSSQTIDKLQRLKAMLDKQLITQQEYDQQKTKLLENL